ncbi:TetR family transcriptional regulator [Streptomyces virginiae]|uniref:TetR-like C-terminal domain-containing protein n=1 Tax=Streptomyces virginiae TaxID=1961 RepID=UPI00177C4AB8|nr:TetR-like C-terminal domain-containing protein [Streptomyces virginiae]GGQ23598.1 TetR family transcriptional regulator [Streptomyces virginiae]
MNVSATQSSDDDVARSAVVKDTARRQLVELGAAGLSLDLVARGSGLAVTDGEPASPPGDPSLAALPSHASAPPGPGRGRPARPPADAGASAGARLLAAARALRQWSFANPAEFTLIYGSPVPGYHAPQDTVPPASRTPAVLAGILRSALEGGELTPPRRTLSGPSLLRPEALDLFGGTPPAPFSDIVERGIALWSSLIGLLVFQVFSRTHDSVRDEAAYFDYAVAVTAETVGLVVPLAEGDH